MPLSSSCHSPPDQAFKHEMGDNPTNSTSFHLRNEWSHQYPKYQDRLSFSSAAFLPPTPAKEPQGRPAESTVIPMAADMKKPCDLSNLMSPPEPTPFDSFRHIDMPAPAQQQAHVDRRAVPNPPISPPVSPPSKAATPIEPVSAASINVQDPIIYPPADSAASPPSGPLFIPNAESPETVNAVTKQLVDEHIASRPSGLFRQGTPPRREDYELALYFKSNCFKMFTANPKAYLRKERELLRADRKNIAAPSRPLAKLHPILPAAKPAVVRGPPGANRITKPKSPKVKIPGPRPIRATPSTTIRQTIRVSSTPEPRVRTVAPNREDKDFQALPDYCPPVDSLPNKVNSLKVDWKGNALDLSRDPHATLLHPDELLLAAALRLDCATYLTSKRRIFIRRLECAKIGKEFRKTDAQQACKIDVNKASKLWTAYEKVGWLEPKWMRGHLTTA